MYEYTTIPYMSMGLKIRTIAITINTIASAPCDQYLAVTAMTIPRVTADTKVHLRFPIPPTMTTAKHNKRIESPI